MSAKSQRPLTLGKRAIVPALVAPLSVLFAWTGAAGGAPPLVGSGSSPSRQPALANGAGPRPASSGAATMTTAGSAAPTPASASTTTPASASTTTQPTTSTTTQAALAASRLLAASIAAANSERGLVWKATLHGAGNDLTEFSHAGRLDGTEVVTGYRNSKRLLMSIVLIGPKAYVRANAVALEALVNMKPQAAKKEAGRWLSVSQADFAQTYQSIAAGLTVSSATQVLDLVGKLTLLPERALAGQTVVGVSGISLAFGAPGSQKVYVRARGAPLPVELVEDYQGVLETMTFGLWGQPPAARAPAAAVPFERSWLQ